MQEVWQEISKNKSNYSCLWSFGIRSLRFRECGLYEVSVLLLGDLTVKDHNVLQEIAKTNPDTEEIFQENLRDTFHLQRP